MTLQYEEIKNLVQKQGAIFVEVMEERGSQNKKFTGSIVGVQRHNLLTWACVLAEESGESVRAAMHVVFKENADKYPYPEACLQPNLAALREELIQTAAVAVAIIERIDAQDDALLAPEGTYVSR